MFNVTHNTKNDSQILATNEFSLDKEMNMFKKDNYDNVKPASIYVQKSTRGDWTKYFSNFKAMVNHMLGLSRKVKKLTFYSASLDRKNFIEIGIKKNAVAFGISDGVTDEMERIIVQWKDGQYNVNFPTNRQSEYFNQIRKVFNNIIESKKKKEAGKDTAATKFALQQQALFKDFGVKFERKQVPYKYAFVYLKIIREVLTNLTIFVGKKNLNCDVVLMDERVALGGFVSSYKGNCIHLKYDRIHPDIIKDREELDNRIYSKYETLYHEFGHALEQQFFTQYKDNKNVLNHYKVGMTKVMEDANFPKLVNYSTKGILNTLQSYLNSSIRRDDFTDYLVSRTEVFARGFSQYMMITHDMPYSKPIDFSYLSDTKEIGALTDYMLEHIKRG